MSETLETFIRESVVRARKELTYEEALKFLRLIAFMYEGEVESLRLALFSLNEGDRQLELIVSGQLRLELPTAVEPRLAA